MYVENKYEIRGETTVLLLEKKRGAALECYIDTEDLSRVGCYRWYGGTKGYAVRTYNREGVTAAVYLHREVMGSPVGLLIDHIDNNPLNNRKSNLRVATRSENAQNRAGAKTGTKSGVRGVSLHSSGNWRGRVQVGGKSYSVGTFASMGLAEAAVKAARARLLPFSKEGTALLAA